MKKSHIILIISVAIFLLSLVLPAVYIRKDSKIYILPLFLPGWADLSGDGTSWLANPIVVFSCSKPDPQTGLKN